MQENRKKSVGNPNARNSDGTFQLVQNEPNGEKPKSTAAQIAEEVGGKILHHPKSSGEIFHLKKRASSKKAVKSKAK